MSKARKGLGIKELKNATDAKLDELVNLVEELKYGDKFLTPLQKESLKELVDPKKFKRPMELVTQREVIEEYKETAEIMSGKITQFIQDNIFPTVDIKEKNALVRRTVDRASNAIDAVETKIIERDKYFDKLLKDAEKARKKHLSMGERFKRAVVPQNVEIFQTLSGQKIALLPEEKLVFTELIKFFGEAKNGLHLERYRKYYVTHLDQSLLEALVQSNGDIKKAIEIVRKRYNRRDLQHRLPVNVMLELDNIIGSKKFFRFALPRAGEVQPTMNLRKIIHTYSELYETKLGLETVLPEGQAITQLLLQPRTADWMRSYLQNLKGRGLDFKFRSGKAGWLSRVADNIVSLGYIKLLGVNYWSAAKNLVAGEANNFITQDFNKFLTGKKRFITEPKKVFEIMRQTHIMEGAFYEYMSQGASLLNRRARDITLIMQKAGEFEIRGSLLAGELTEAEWAAGAISPQRTREIKDLIAKSQGVFTAVDTPLWLQTWYGRMFTQMNRWRITNINLLRRTVPKAYKDYKAGKRNTRAQRQLLKMFFMYGMGMYLAYELRKAGFKRAAKVAQSSAEVINSIVSLFTTPVILDMVRNNPTISFMGETFFSIQQLANYIGVPGVEEPRNIIFQQGLGDTYIAPVERGKELLGIGGDGGSADLDFDFDFDFDLDLDLDLDL